LRRLPASRGLTASPDARAFLAIAGAVVLANILYLMGVFDPNPLGIQSGLGRVTSPGLLGGLPTIDPNNGVTSQALGHLAVHDWLHLQLPWWNPYEGTGTPLAGEMAGAALFPFTILTAVANGQLYERILLELLAGVATYLLLRRLAVSRWASTAAAIVFALNGTFAWFSHAPINAIPFLPLVLLGIETAFSYSIAGRAGGWWLIAIAAALSACAGFPETAYIDALFAVLWFGWRCGCADRRHLRAFASKVVLGAIVAGLLAAPILVAFADYSALSTNSHAAAALYNVHLPHAALSQLLLPYVYGPIFGFGGAIGPVASIWDSVGGYLSTSLLFFGLLGLVSPGRRGLRLILLVSIVFAVAGIYGYPGGLSNVLGVLPGSSHVAFYRYANPALELAVVILAAFGMDYLTTRSAADWRLLAVTAVSLAAVAAATIETVHLVDTLSSAFPRTYSTGSFIWAVAIIAAAGLAALLRSSRTRRLLVASIVSLDALVLFVLPEFSAPRNVTIDTAPAAFLQRHIGLSRFATLGPLQPNYGSYFGVRSVNTDDALLPKIFGTYVNEHLDPAISPLIFTGTLPGAPPAATGKQELLTNLNGYRAASVRYVLAPEGLELPLGPNAFTIVFRSPTTLIYRLAGTSPYFTATNPACTAQAQSGESVRVSCPSPTTLVRRETYMPGWSAEVDGQARPVREFDGAFQAVTVGSGTHRVTFAFTPPGMEWALVGFAAGCVCLLAAPLLRRTRLRTGPAADHLAEPH
jgi:hypothetical protein